MALSITWTAKVDREVPVRFRTEMLARTARTGQIVVEALKKNLTGSRTGRWYYKPGGGMYRASAPGEYPARRTGNLRAGVGSLWDPRNARVVIGTNVPYGVYLEKKPPSQGGRPWLKRAADESASRIRDVWKAPWRLT